MLAETFLQRSRAATGKPIEELSIEAMQKLLDYHWPGNVRELKSAIDFATLHCGGTVIDADDLPPEVESPGAPQARRVEDRRPKTEAERIRAALDAAGGNRSLAAKKLGISRATLYRRLDALSTEIRGDRSGPPQDRRSGVPARQVETP